MDSAILKTLTTAFLVLVFIFIVDADQNVLRAQVAGATVSGTVTDKSGRVIQSANVTFTNVATSVDRVVTTNDEGLYTAPNLAPGSYRLKFAAAGFKTELRTGLELTVGAAAVVNMAM